MFSRVCIIPSVYGGGHAWRRGVCMVKVGGCVVKGVWQSRGVWGGDMHGRGHAWQGACVAGT